jgi:hypothetical protein|tara:strand:- start:98 stop:199 length:102 start_codon:yes stop_codon:yes gene_type:complete
MEAGVSPAKATVVEAARGALGAREAREAVLDEG